MGGIGGLDPDEGLIPQKNCADCVFIFPFETKQHNCVFSWMAEADISLKTHCTKWVPNKLPVTCRDRTEEGFHLEM